MFQKISKTKSGYTIIETMVAISIFVVVVVFGTNTLLNANLVARKSNDMRSIMDNLNFIMEDISRNARVGYDYECFSSVDSIDSIDPSISRNLPTQDQSLASTAQSQFEALTNTPRSCNDGKVLFIETSNGLVSDSTGNHRSDQLVYIFKETAVGSGIFQLYKSINGGVSFVRTVTAEQLNPTEIIFKAGSGFSVLGAEPPSVNALTDNRQQPLLMIRLVGEIKYKNTVTPFSLQTSVSQRLIDVKF